MLRYLIFGIILTLGVAKSYVFYMEKHVASLKKNIRKESELINLLKVEWTYLNQSSRLVKLVEIYLKNWKQIAPLQMKNIVEVKKIIKEYKEPVELNSLANNR